MKITRFWELFYHLKSVPKIKSQGIWEFGFRFQVSGVRCQVSGVRCQVSVYGGYKLIEFSENFSLLFGFFVNRCSVEV